MYTFCKKAFRLLIIVILYLKSHSLSCSLSHQKYWLDIFPPQFEDSVPFQFQFDFLFLCFKETTCHKSLRSFFWRHLSNEYDLRMIGQVSEGACTTYLPFNSVSIQDPVRRADDSGEAIDSGGNNHSRIASHLPLTHKGLGRKQRERLLSATSQRQTDKWYWCTYNGGNDHKSSQNNVNMQTLHFQIMQVKIDLILS